MRGLQRPASEHFLEASITNAPADDSLSCVAQKLQLGSAHVQIEALGTSVTRGPLFGQSYVSLLRRRLRRRFPRANFTLSQRGYPGASVDYLNACVDRMLPVDADLYLLETTDNLGYTSASWASTQMNEIISSLQGRRPGQEPAIIIVAPFSQTCAKKLIGSWKTGRGWVHDRKRPGNDSVAATKRSLAQCFSRTALPTALEALAVARGLPCVSVRSALRRDLQGSLDRAAINATLRQFLLPDLIHPSERGYGLIANASLRVILNAAQGRPPACKGQRARVEPRARRSGARGNACAFGEALHELVIASRGWHYVVERSAQGQPKPGYVATTPNATLEVCHHGITAQPGGGQGLARLGSKAFLWQFGYLRSYRGLGVVQGECVRGCRCAPRQWDAHIRRHVSQTAISKLAVKPLRTGVLPAAAGGCPCVIRLTVLNSTTSGGHKFKLEALFGAFAMYNTNYAVCGSPLCAYMPEREPV